MAKQRAVARKIEFRWRHHEHEFSQRLHEQAVEAGRPDGEHARELLKNILTSGEQNYQDHQTIMEHLTHVRHSVETLTGLKEGTRVVHENLYQFRDDFVTCVAQLLVSAGHLTPKQAKQWLRQSLNVR